MASPPNKDCLMALVASMAVIIIIAVHLPNACSYEYCSIQDELCPPHADVNRTYYGHLVCNASQVPMNATFVTLYPMTRRIKNYLIHTHNRLRNQVASGWERDKNRGNFPQAHRMRELIWDDELEFLAKMHAQRCNWVHDDCRNTVRFPYAGQNLAWRGSNSPKTVFMAIDFALLRWYGEKDLVEDGEALANLYVTGTGIGHFTQLMTEQASRLGCAISYCINCGNPHLKHCYYVTCDYDISNIKHVRMYTSSKINKKVNGSASDCAYYNTTKSHVYLHLCANSGAYFKAKGPYSEW